LPEREARGDQGVGVEETDAKVVDLALGHDGRRSARLGCHIEVELLDPGHQLREVYEARSSTVGVVGTLPPPGRKRRSRPGWLAVLGS